jgi:FlaA1/EpsC-like NDP-sugar epimerase
MPGIQVQGSKLKSHIAKRRKKKGKDDGDRHGEKRQSTLVNSQAMKNRIKGKRIFEIEKEILRWKTRRKALFARGRL